MACKTLYSNMSHSLYEGGGRKQRLFNSAGLGFVVLFYSFPLVLSQEWLLPDSSIIFFFFSLFLSCICVWSFSAVKQER